MYLNEIIGQEELKLKLKKMVNKGQFPHCQLFIDSKGYGALPLALSCGMGLIYGFEFLDNEEQKGFHLINFIIILTYILFIQ